MSSVRYRKLRTDEQRDTDETDSSRSDFVSSQFEKPAAKTPWRAILYAAVLFLGGSVLLVLGSMIVTGHLDPDTHGERFWPLVLLGGECSYLFLVLTMSTLHTKPSQETQTRVDKCPVTLTFHAVQ